MNAFHGIEASTGFDYDADAFDRAFERALEDDDACAQFVNDYIDNPTVRALFELFVSDRMGG